MTTYHNEEKCSQYHLLAKAQERNEIVALVCQPGVTCDRDKLEEAGVNLEDLLVSLPRSENEADTMIAMLTRAGASVFFL